MKFVCPNCKAKYQIADEKVSGRTLKMDCRRCGHHIVLRGELQEEGSAGEPATAPVSAAPSPTTTSGSASTKAPRSVAPGRATGSSPGTRRPTAAGRGGSHAGPAPAPRSVAPQRSALSADFRRSIAAGAPAAPEAPKGAPLDQWHVGINDVPVGPIRRDEIARKIATGAITADSLAWREGFEDWRPIKEIPELAQLLKRPEGGVSERPGPARPAGARAPARPTGAAKPAVKPGAPAPARPDGRLDPLRTAARSNVVPIGGRLGASAAPAIDEEPKSDFDDIDAEPTRVASTFDFAAADAAARNEVAQAKAEAIKPEPPRPEPTRDRASSPGAVASPRVSVIPDPFGSSAATTSSATTVALPVEPTRPERERDDRKAAVGPLGLPYGVWVGIAGAMAFGAVMAAIIAPSLVASPAPAAVATTQPQPQAPPPSAPAPQEAAAPPAEPAPAPEAPVAEAAPPTPEQHATGSHTRRPTTGGSTTTARPSTNPTPPPSAAFDRFAGIGGDHGPAPIAPRPITTERHGGGASDEGLSGDQIRAVVAREQRGLQNCWQVAIRGQRDVPDTRMEIHIRIGRSGTVTSAQARGVGIGNLTQCLEQNVRRWRFPAAGGESETQFPVVFQGI